MTESLTHITKQGDRWDLLAWDYYGDATRVDLLTAANPDVTPVLILPAGLTLVVPIIDEPEPDAAPGLPPWRS